MRRLIVLLFILFSVEYVESQQWFYEYPCNEDEEVFFITGDMSANYNFVLGTLYDNDSNLSTPIALCFDENGNYIDKMFCSTFPNSSFITSLGLGDGNVFVAAVCGVSENMYEKLWVAVLNPDLNILTENYLEFDEPYISFGSSAQTLMNNNDDIVLVTKVTDSIPSNTIIEYDFVFYELDGSCNLLKQSYLENPSYHSEISDFIKVPNSDYYAMFSDGMHVSGVVTMSYIDDNLNCVSTSIIDKMSNYPDNILPKFVSVDYWYDENHFLMSSMSAHTEGINDWHPLVLKMDTDMNIVKSLSLERVDTTDYVSQYRNMAYVNKDKIYISTFWQNGSYFESFPNTATVFLINNQLDLLGRKDFDLGGFMNIFYVQPTFDEGCIIQACLDYNTCKVPMICKLKSEDFEYLTNVIENDENLGFYPDPVSSVLNINVKNIMNGKVRIVITDMLGRRCLEKDICLNENTLSINVSLLRKGTYLCYIRSEDGRYVQTSKFIKE